MINCRSIIAELYWQLWPMMVDEWRHDREDPTHSAEEVRSLEKTSSGTWVLGYYRVSIRKIIVIVDCGQMRF